MRMIEIQAGGIALELPDNFVFSHTEKSPLWFGGDFNVIEGGYTIPANISARSPVNRRGLGYPENVANYAQFGAEIASDIFIAGNYFKSGTLRVKLADPDTYRIQIFTAAGDLVRLKEKTLKDYDYGSVEITGSDPNDFSFNFQVRKALTQTEPGYNYLMYYSYVFYEIFNYEAFLETISLYVKDLLSTIFSSEGYELDDQVFSSGELAKLLLFHPRFYFTAENGLKTSVQETLSDHVPKMLVSDFLKGLRKNFFLSIVLDSKKKKATFQRLADVLNTTESIDLSDAVVGQIQIQDTELSLKKLSFDIDDPLKEDNSEGKNLLKYNEQPPVLTLSDLPDNANEGDVRFVYEYYRYISYVRYWESEHMFESLTDVTVGTSGSDIKSNLSTSFTKYIQQTGQLVPYTKRSVEYGNEAGDNYVEQGQLLIYRGRHQLLQGGVGPLVLGHNYHNDGTRLGDYSLRWHGADGLYEKHVKPWLDFINNSREVSIPMQPRLRDLFQFDFLTPALLYDQHSGTYQRYFFKEWKTVVDMHRIREVKQKAIQIID